MNASKKNVRLKRVKDEVWQNRIGSVFYSGDFDETDPGWEVLGRGSWAAEGGFAWVVLLAEWSSIILKYGCETVDVETLTTENVGKLLKRHRASRETAKHFRAVVALARTYL